ncbi:sugar transporter SWEET1 [Takifugu rubripes]|uniref:Sugar transporter SWEET1 n=2 Tax=Takifugu TaxID=31032 RepID=H2SYZ1_TAKRU|nr:sugar transporter SWEET1 [Takifugu rubripes]XP_011604125.1 sugar transporter SWEET1 [Takifugu rubripes]XP_056900256.1 sugar transporter SWEET1 [Takifugu flavidus]XP_056900257.1 sugar transporter SWEET1 [Takifugu flavidus]TWW79181.1 Sugar transporter SWEET1 RAG1-activating protein 1 [Takifugu flavidus]|eukprot:XP_003966285.1 PREDICTED: sugar transporter SWEET1 [Takifugu rubripes]
MDLVNLLSWACIVFTLGMFSTGLSDMRKMQESKSTDNIQFLPFLTTCLNNLGWLYYGVLKSDQTIILVNVIGALLQILYIIMYLRYTKVKNLVGAQTLIAGIILLCGWLYFTVFLPKGETQLSQLGFTCSVVTVSMYLSPLSSLLEMVRSRDVQCLSFPLTVTTLLTSTSWVLYGLQVSDLYIVVPNTPGIITSLIRFYLFWKFGSSHSGSPSYKPMPI